MHERAANDHRRTEMKEKIALFGAGGKMGVRLAKNLKKLRKIIFHILENSISS